MLEELLKTARPIPGYENYYATRCGKIISTKYTKPRILRGNPTNRPYLHVTLSKNNIQHNRTVHRLIATTFYGEPRENQEVRHLDGNPLNNHVDNLRWGDKEDNQQDRERHGTVGRGMTHPLARLTDKEVLVIRKLRAMKVPCTRIAKIFDIKPVTAQAIGDRRIWKHLP